MVKGDRSTNRDRMIDMITVIIVLAIGIGISEEANKRWGEKTFNPDEDTVTEKCDYLVQSEISGEWFCMNYWGSSLSARGNRVSEWRQKTHCELDPNDEENCVCEEKNYVDGDECFPREIDEQLTFRWGLLDAVGIIEGNMCLDENNTWGLTIKLNCIKSREKKKFKEGDWLIFNKDYQPFKKGHISYVWKQFIGLSDILVVTQPNGNFRNVEDKGFEDSVDFYEPNECEKGNPDYKGEYKCNPLTLKNNSAGQQTFDCENPVITSCRKFTECEKGNQNYIEECKTFIPFADGSPCVEKICREKSECEKENPDWIMDKGSVYSEHYEDGALKYLSLVLPFCRKKTIQDYSCKDLKYHLLVDKSLMKSFCKWYEPCITKYHNQEDIYQTMIEKGCEI